MQRCHRFSISFVGLLTISIVSTAEGQQTQPRAPRSFEAASRGQSHKAALHALFRPIEPAAAANRAQATTGGASANFTETSYQVQQAGFVQPMRQPPPLQTVPVSAAEPTDEPRFQLPRGFTDSDRRAESAPTRMAAGQISNPPSLAGAVPPTATARGTIQPTAAAVQASSPQRTSLWDEGSVATVSNSPHVTAPIRQVSTATYAVEPCPPVGPVVPSAPYAGPTTIVPPTVTPAVAPQYFVGDEPGYGPLLTLGQQPYNVVIGRGIIGQPVAYVPGQYLRNFLRYLSP